MEALDAAAPPEVVNPEALDLPAPPESAVAGPEKRFSQRD